MHSQLKDDAVSITIEQEQQSYFTRVFIQGKPVQSEKFHTEAAAFLAAEFLEKAYSK